MAKDYTVGNPRLSTEISDTGTGFVKTWTVPYTITSGAATGTRGEVTVPADQYTADNVHGAIQTAVAVHQEVLGR